MAEAASVTSQKATAGLQLFNIIQSPLFRPAVTLKIIFCNGAIGIRYNIVVDVSNRDEISIKIMNIAKLHNSFLPKRFEPTILCLIMLTRQILPV